MLKLSAHVGLATASLLAFSISPASAGQFTATYDFGGVDTTGDVFTFKFDGDRNGNLIENISNLSSFTFGNTNIFNPANSSPYGGPLVPQEPFSTLSFNGFQNDFFGANPTVSEGFIISSAGEIAQLNDFGVVFLEESFEPTRWSVVDTTAIPTPALLPSIVGMSFAILRKRNAAQSDET